jgi:metal-responsive CopG/Arc/MetJ family transcriptional regulator
MSNQDGGLSQYGEVKQRVNISITPTAIQALDAIAEKEGLSRSEVIERYARASMNSDDLKAEGHDIRNLVDVVRKLRLKVKDLREITQRLEKELKSMGADLD